MSYNVNLQHIIFRTYRSQPTINELHKKLLLTYIISVSKELNVNILSINAYKNHVHLLCDIPTTLIISEYVRKIKSTSSTAFKGHVSFPGFQGWAKRYGSISVSPYEAQHIMNYIAGQEEHHRHKTFLEELENLFGSEFVRNDKYLRENWID